MTSLMHLRDNYEDIDGDNDRAPTMDSIARTERVHAVILSMGVPCEPGTNAEGGALIRFRSGDGRAWLCCFNRGDNYAVAYPKNVDDGIGLYHFDPNDGASVRGAVDKCIAYLSARYAMARITYPVDADGRAV